jgi:signal transduction histidine kinase
MWGAYLAYRVAGERSGAYLVLESLESFGFAHGSTLLVGLSGQTTSVWWLLYFALCVYDGSAMGTRRVSGAILVTAPITAAIVLYARSHAAVDAVAALVIGGLGAVAWRLIAKGTDRSFVEAAERDVLRDRIAELELERHRARAEEERRHIAMELHDGVGATLTAARLMAQAMRNDGAGRERANTLEALDTLDQTLRDGLSDLRLAVWSIDHDSLPWSELFARIRRHCADICVAAGLAFTMSVRGERVDSAPPALRLALFRLVQEALTNTIRHAGAKSVSVNVTISHEAVAVLYRDDGAGFAKERATEGHGLVNIERRVRAMNGTFTLESSAAHGTCLDIRLPSPSDGA